MEPGKWALQALEMIESETRDLVQSGAPTRKSETDMDIAPLVEKIGATSIAEVEKMIGELQAAKDFLESEGERVQREAEHYTTLTQMASASVKIISDTVAGWREAGHPLRDRSRSSQFDLTLSPAEDNSTSARVQDHHQPQSQRPIRARTRGEAIPWNSIGRGTVVARVGVVPPRGYHPLYATRRRYTIR